MFGKKGQGAMEYLMTYGWAILVVMIVGILLWQLGILHLGNPPAITASGFSKIKPQLASCKMSTGGTFNCLFTNGAGSAIAVNSTSVATGTTACTVSAPSQTVPQRVPIGNNFQVTATGCTAGTAGEAYAVDVSFYYTMTIAGVGVTHNDTGKLRGPYEIA